MTTDLPSVVQEILDPFARVAAGHFTQLSDLDAPSTDQVVNALRAVSFERRRVLISTMTELAEENVDLNFIPIFRQCLDDEDGEVRETAIKGLWECEDRWLIEPLLARMRSDAEEGVRIAAAQAMGRFALLAEFGKLLERDGEKIARSLLELIDGEGETSQDVRRRAIEAIAPINTPRVRDVIRDGYESADDQVKASALYAMGRNGDPVCISYVLQELDSDEPALRYEAVGAAGRLGDETLLPALVRLIDDDSSEVLGAVITAISAIGTPTAQRVLRRLLKHSDDRVRELALDAIESMQQFEAPGMDILKRPAPDGVLDDAAGDDDVDLDDLEHLIEGDEDDDDDDA